tara:strand:+ start:3287 stop:3988 length:702 start_codon:yes stop_codon:yes gene_type:complete
MTKIIGISGRKQAGKNTVANCLHGVKFVSRGNAQSYDISNDGELMIQTSDSKGTVGWGIFDVLRSDIDFLSYAEHEIWPYVKIYHFADYLKKMSMDLFDLSPRQVYGTDADKNTATPYNMTAREFLQYLGTDVMRKIKDTIWVDYTIKLINLEGTEVAIIPDVRFPNEVNAIHEAGGIVVRLTRDVHNSEHPCETALDKEHFDWSNFDYILDNQDCSVSELKNRVEKISNKIL